MGAEPIPDREANEGSSEPAYSTVNEDLEIVGRVSPRIIFTLWRLLSCAWTLHKRALNCHETVTRIYPPFHCQAVHFSWAIVLEILACGPG